MRKKINTSFFIFVFQATVAMCCIVNFARAADSDLIITEIMYADNQGEGNQYDWVELYNKGTADITIIGGTSKQSWRFSDDLLKNEKHTFPSGNKIVKPSDFLILAKDPSAIKNKYEDISEDKMIKVSFDLLETKEIALAISNDAGTSWFYNMKYDPMWGGKNNGKTLEKIDLAGGDEGKNWRESSCPGGSPGEKSKECETDPGDQIEDSDPPSTENSDNTPVSSPKKIYSKNIKITELLPNPSDDEDTGEFTELYNADSKEIIGLSGWKLEDKTGNPYLLPDVSIEPGKYRAFYRNSSKFSLNNTGSEEIFLKNPDGEIVDHVSYSGTVKENYSYALGGEAFSWTSAPTPGEKNVITAPEAAEKNTTETKNPSEATENYTSGANIYLNEILPNPKNGSDGEYIEIVNGGNEPADLAGWRIKDASKSKGYQFKDHTLLNPGEYLVIYRPESKIALNNSDESVYLYDPSEKITSSVSYGKSQKNASYNFDGENWKWSKYLTPGKKNKFDSEPTVKIKKIKHAYKDLYTEFSASAKDKETKKLKYVWDFGDGQKSYIAKTSHKYLATGQYTVTLSVSDNSQTVEKSFTLEVKKYPRPDVEIVKIVPNPAGKDEDGEIIDIRNNSGNKIDLVGWKIATGSGDKMYNHPISSEFVFDAGETKTITREFSKFSLNNKAGKVQLVMPDGKIIDEIEYAKEKIDDDETYAKIDGEWKWVGPGAKDENTDKSDTTEGDTIVDDRNSDESANNGEVLGATDENISVSSNYDSRFTSEDAYIFLSQINFAKPAEKETACCSATNPSSTIAYLLASLI